METALTGGQREPAVRHCHSVAAVLSSNVVLSRWMYQQTRAALPCDKHAQSVDNQPTSIVEELSRCSRQSKQAHTRHGCMKTAHRWPKRFSVDYNKGGCWGGGVEYHARRAQWFIQAKAGKKKYNRAERRKHKAPGVSKAKLDERKPTSVGRAEPKARDKKIYIYQARTGVSTPPAPL